MARLMLPMLLLFVWPSAAQAMSALATKALCADVEKAETHADVAKKEAAAGEALFAERADSKKAREALATWERSLAADANQPELRVKLARLYYLVADGYDRLAENDDAMVEGFEKGMAHAGLALGQLNPAFKRKICSGAPLPEAVATLDKASVPAAYWFATHVGKYGLAKDMLEVLANKDMIYAVMEVLRKLVPDYFFFAPDRYLGGYYTKVPFPKGDPAQALQHFMASRRGAPKYFATYNLIAELYAPRAISAIDPRSTQCKVGAPKIAAEAPAPKYHPCRALFQEVLKVVLEGKNELPEIAAEQAVEQEKAKKLVKELDTFFPPLN